MRHFLFCFVDFLFWTLGRNSLNFVKGYRKKLAKPPFVLFFFLFFVLFVFRFAWRKGESAIN